VAVYSSLIATCFPSGTKAFSTIFGSDYDWDESRYVEFVSHELKLKSHCVPYSFYQFLVSITGGFYLTGGINHPHTFAIEQLAAFASKKLKVLFSGEGADELFLGYERYLGCDRRDDVSIANNAAFYSDSELSYIFNIDARSANLGRLDYLAGCNVCGDLNRLRALEFRFHLENLLERYDSATMKHGVEGRVPFLSLPFAKKYLAVEPEYLMGVEGKEVLKRLAASRFGKAFAFRKKVGYRVPFDEYIYDFNTTNLLKLIVKSDLVRQYVRPKILEELRYQRGVFNDKSIFPRLFWTLRNLSCI
jgi:asparagine synthase (glutamine-hydrolysing)